MAPEDESLDVVDVDNDNETEPASSSHSFTFVATAIFFFLMGCETVALLYAHNEKHTGPVVITSAHGDSYDMRRPNREIFSMDFLNGAPLHDGQRLDDVVYTDASTPRYQRFVKATAAEAQYQSVYSANIGNLAVIEVNDPRFTFKCLTFDQTALVLGPNYSAPECWKDKTPPTK